MSASPIQGPSGLKRKRRRQNSTDSDSSTEAEYKLYTKYYSTNRSKIKNVKKTGGPEEVAPLEKPDGAKKRKFVYNIEDIVPKKSKKYIYLGNGMTKPRKPKKVPVDLEPPQPDNSKTRKHKLHFARADSSGNVTLVHRTSAKSDLFFNDEKQQNYEDSKKQDLSFHIVDEIALEGLDGITVEALWKRLKNIFPNYISKAIADRMWRLICNNKRITFYVLKEPREKLTCFDRFKYMDMDAVVYVEPFIEYNDIYPLSYVNTSEVRGSCSTFNTRKENNGVRRFSMEKALNLLVKV